jgi:8-oxo-dGTP pyrophosphatase MutT (NUDIX family)
MRYLEKVTAFVTRSGPGGTELLLFEHPHAGIQIPAGTVEEGEDPRQAVLREVCEETGLEACLESWHASQETVLPEGQRVVLQRTPVFSRPDAGSFDWASFRRGIPVCEERRAGGFVQVTYQEGDRYPDPEYNSYHITGWVPEEVLGDGLRRFFYHLSVPAGGPPAWEQRSDQHLFRPFWAGIHALPAIVPPQQTWLDFALQTWKPDGGAAAI